MIGLQLPHNFHTREYLSGMGGIFELGGKVLASPVFVMLALLPETAWAYVVDESAEGHPGFGAVLPVSQGQLGKTELTQFHMLRFLQY